MINFKSLFIIFLVVVSIIACKSTDNNNTNAQNVNVVDTLNLAKESVDLTFLKDEEGTIRIPFNVLMNVKLVDTLDKVLGDTVALPVWNDTLLSLEGKEVIIEGFYIPVDETGKSDIVVLSAFPFSQCFFCGKAGIESIVDVLPKGKLPKMKVDSKVKFKGTFTLNYDNYDYLIYILKDAELID